MLRQTVPFLSLFALRWTNKENLSLKAFSCEIIILYYIILFSFLISYARVPRAVKLREFLYRKDFTEVFKNLNKYRSENNWTVKIIM